MPVKDEAQLRARCELVTSSLVELLGIAGWMNVYCGFSTRNVEGEERILCEYKGDWVYRQGTLIWNLLVVATTPDVDMWDTAVHELCHALMGPLWESLPDAKKAKLHDLNELATESISRVICYLLREAYVYE